MKKFYLLSVLLFGFFNMYSQTQITLTFHAKDSLTQSSLALDSVHVQNLTQNCDTTLFDSVPVLTLPAEWPVGIGETSPGGGSFILMQNAPNPFEGITTVPVYLKNAEVLNLAVYDLRGNKLSQYSNEFEKGWHSFVVSTNGASLLVLMVSDNTSLKTIKLLSTGSGSEGDRISYEGLSGNSPTLLKSVQSSPGFIFYLGNQLQYTAYVGGYVENILIDNPVSSENYTFTMYPSFTCGDSVNYSSQYYHTLLIGTQCWFKENLNVGTMINGTHNQTNNSVIEKYCYNNLTSNCDIYGGLYQWGEMVQYLNGTSNTTTWNPPPTGNVQGICPTGWHIPKDAEWTVLTTYLGGVSVAGGAMKETGYAHWSSPNTGATNSSGFTALGSGLRWSNNPPPYFYQLKDVTYFPAATETSSTTYSSWMLTTNSATVLQGGGTDKTSAGFPVRCLKD
jgi:uncharacterized protein (TIGR02145 family)